MLRTKTTSAINTTRKKLNFPVFILFNFSWKRDHPQAFGFFCTPLNQDILRCHPLSPQTTFQHDQFQLLAHQYRPSTRVWFWEPSKKIVVIANMWSFSTFDNKPSNHYEQSWMWQVKHYLFINLPETLGPQYQGWSNRLSDFQ